MAARVHSSTTPATVTDEIKAVCAELKTEAPVFVEVSPVAGTVPGKCWNNAEALAKADGGRVVYGRLIWELKGIWLSGEHHAVVEKDGNLIDVTPQPDREKSILFAPDYSQTDFKPPRPATQHKPLVESNLIKRWCELATIQDAMAINSCAALVMIAESPTSICKPLPVHMIRSRFGRKTTAQSYSVQPRHIHR